MSARQPTELQLRLLERIRQIETGEMDRSRLVGVHRIHRSRQVIMRAVNLCKRYGWLRQLRSGELRLTAAGRKAVKP